MELIGYDGLTFLDTGKVLFKNNNYGRKTESLY